MNVEQAEKILLILGHSRTSCQEDNPTINGFLAQHASNGPYVRCARCFLLIHQNNPSMLSWVDYTVSVSIRNPNQERIAELEKELAELKRLPNEVYGATEAFLALKRLP